MPKPDVFPVSENALVVITKNKTYERHPSGEGLRPIRESDRGGITLPCPECGKPLVRDTTEALWRRSVVRCPNSECDKIFSGKLYPEKPQAPDTD